MYENDRVPTETIPLTPLLVCNTFENCLGKTLTKSQDFWHVNKIASNLHPVGRIIGNKKMHLWDLVVSRWGNKTLNKYRLEYFSANVDNKIDWTYIELLIIMLCCPYSGPA